MYYIHLLVAAVFGIIVYYQARGREESRLLWCSIYTSLALLICLIPVTYLACLSLGALHMLIVSCMGKWKRKAVIVAYGHGMERSKVKEDFTNIVGVAEDEDLILIDVSHELTDPIAIKTYTNIAQQEELWNDLKVLKTNRIRYKVNSGILTTLLVDAPAAGKACDLLNIQVEMINSPSVN
jgi:hypothetical protein